MHHPSHASAGYTISTDPADIDFDALYAFLSASYWSRGIPRETMERSVRGSLPFVLRRGLSKRLMEAIMGHPELQNFRRWMLATSDAHGLYEKFGFRPLAAPDVLMERHDPNVYVPRD